MTHSKIKNIIAALPVDTAERQAFGRELAARGEPLGEFILVQCELARLQQLIPPPLSRSMPADRVSALTEQFQNLTRREGDLWKRYAQDWTQPAKELGVGDVLFVNGAPDTLYIDDATAFAANIDAIVQTLPTARRVSFRFPDIMEVSQKEVIRTVCSAPNLSHFETIGFVGWDGDRIASVMATSPNLNGLQTLDLLDCNVGPAGATAIFRSKHLRSLRQLDLSGNPIGPAGVAAVGESSLRALKTLRLLSTGIGDAGAHALSKGAAALPSLRRLDVSDNPLSLDAISAILNSPALARVTVDISTDHLPAAIAAGINKKLSEHNDFGQGANAGRE
ncbi:hypothetical protein FTUN_8985 (plasmid) [Frigoriglobus tundricola]|uniref:Leucine Rich repeats (2 copies) n=2 Tax=Frigoriglobus tundricola TaxID=2774151 RepID=A0A6M5Z7M1_9BACT|nr:hypothetical protein FTUN_8985 [Frigoriglobus tundricola]